MSPRDNNMSKIHWALHVSGINTQQKLILVTLAHLAGDHDAFDVDLGSLCAVVPLDTVVVRRMLQNMAKQGLFDVKIQGSKATISFNQSPPVQPASVITGLANSLSGEPSILSPSHRFSLSAEWEPASIGMLSMLLRNKHIEPLEVDAQIYGKALDRLRHRYIGNADEKRTERQWVELYSRTVLETLIEVQGEEAASAENGG